MKIIAIYVIYNPIFDILQKSIMTLIHQVDEIWISDNSFKKQNTFIGHKKINYNWLNGNKGISIAQNYGIQYAINKGYEYIIFMDQDSIVKDNYISNLTSAFNTIKKYDPNIVAIGPQAINRDTNKELNTNSYKSLKKAEDLSYIEVDELMCSGSLWQTDVFNKIGLMDETLFIDGVDYEICWRANKLTNSIFAIYPKCKIEHQLGNGDIKLLQFTLHTPSPIRLYYQYRNYLWLTKRNYVPNRWKIYNGIKYSIKIFLYPFILPNRKEIVKNILKGIKDGFKNA